ncbi:WD40-repeat-containing domain protein [Protomyces lactucae-debilis]|uniref:WD40-repeat-containing domain protein n=1 Tax=Protomyces lactucae-debilis TaxID=2754530 RepID=A0A1Y2FDB6_PROLT|nr:WD40-repeat-containing domain protein [Protomyces lactucae-debilis]ORY81920.1 WD40-repeat-containing domain protein [Protomyces lactucae-debilis]
MYTKATQTSDDAELEEDTDEDDSARDVAAADAAAAQATLAAQEALIAQLREEIRAELLANEEEERQRRLEQEPPPPPPPAELSTGSMIQRYTADDTDLDTNGQDAQVRLVAQLKNSHSAHRSITYIHFSPKFPELVLAAYSRNPLAPSESDGLVQVFSLLKPDEPVFTLTAGSEIRIAQFSPFHPQLIFGGAYSGQVLIWDTRTPGLPILKSPQTAGRGHSHPVTAMQLVGTRHAHSLVSIAADGTVCSWSPDVLAKPQDFLQLRNLPPAKLDDIAPTGIAVDATDSTRFLMSTEEGHLVRVHRQDRADAKAGVDPRIVYRGHLASITNLDPHPAAAQPAQQSQAGGLAGWVLTSSLDWSVKLWNTTPTTRAVGTIAVSSQHPYGATDDVPMIVVSPIMEFPNTQPVYDVHWSPHRPGVFAQVDGAGELQIWDLCQGSEVPVSRITPGLGPGEPARALNRLAWEMEHGRRIAVGGLDGILNVLDIGELGGPATQEEWSTLTTLIERMQ